MYLAKVLFYMHCSLKFTFYGIMGNYLVLFHSDKADWGPHPSYAIGNTVTAVGVWG